MPKFKPDYKDDALSRFSSEGFAAKQTAKNFSGKPSRSGAALSLSLSKRFQGAQVSKSNDPVKRVLENVFGFAPEDHAAVEAGQHSFKIDLGVLVRGMSRPPVGTS